MSQATEDFSRQTVRVVRSLEPILLEHLEENFDEMLPHLYFGELSQWVSVNVASQSAMSEITKFLMFLDRSYPTADEDVQNLIDASFVENVEDDPRVVALFGPTLLSRVAPHYRPD